ncbi:bifunctional chorismate synthase/riboflavin reductase [NAD(P)H] aro2 [Coemansia sp. RSA 1836]|nr:bifunctional chorismate synthase/riboflavin reductase [NAD(P)H] aro2 [Coemansia sp. RSA 25]KAJ2580609.1 bifunctional chorismate synthase/riboflavin reductase [NAD(P)H] aro2 [Coemansia sp. RSA 1836]
MSTFGSAFRVTTYGESHCKSVGCIIDGVPPGLALTEADIQAQLTRRRPGQSKLTTPRNEADSVTIQSGCELGFTLGTPICLTVPNQDHRPHDYSETDLYPRPSHADYTYMQKYGIKASSGGGRSSARETIGRVAAGAVAEKYLAEVHGVEIVAFVTGVGPVQVADAALAALVESVTREEVDATAVRCPDAAAAPAMHAEIVACADEKNSTGGVVTCVIRNAPAGLGEPCFDKLEARLAHAMLSIPATKGFEIGSGFAGTRMRGSAHNDAFEADGARGGLRTRTNHSGGVQGGISNGAPIVFRVAFKPPATIAQDQRTATYAGAGGVLAARGRHDPCVVPRAVPIVEAMAALVLMDAVLQQNGRTATRQPLRAVPSELLSIKPF